MAARKVYVQAHLSIGNVLLTGHTLSLALCADFLLARKWQRVKLSVTYLLIPAFPLPQNNGAPAVAAAALIRGFCQP